MRFRAFAAASWLALPLLTAGCFVYGESLLEPGGTGGDGGTTTATTGGSGGSDCTVPEDCPDPGTPCKKRVCDGGACGTTPVPDAVPADPTPGDCRVLLCDSGGAEFEVESSSDVPDDQNTCTLDLCEFGAPVHKPKTGYACGPNGTEVCNDEGACVECISPNDCASMLCQDNMCVSPGCNDGAKNGSETDVDCGGGCQDCATGKACKVNTDCKSAVCQSMICQPSCTDGAKNNAETDVDCGGGTCAKCDDGETCSVANDCKSAVCSSTKCAAPTCMDGQKNGTETAVDCGGPTCPSCPLDHIVINEVDYDQPGVDGMEFVEIYNATTGTVSLAGLKLVPIEGTSSLPYYPIDLGPAGSLAPGQYLVVGAPAVVPAAGALKIDFPASTNLLSNGQSGGSGSPDGVALFDDTNNQLIDVFSYEGEITAADLSMWGLGTVSLVEGIALPDNVEDDDVGSLCRLPNAKDTGNASVDWGLSSLATPGAANVP